MEAHIHHCMMHNFTYVYMCMYFDSRHKADILVYVQAYVDAKGWNESEMASFDAS